MLSTALCIFCVLNFAVICGTVGISQTTLEVCQDLIARGDCAFYTECAEVLQQCGQKGYVKSYAFKYCKRFTEARDHFDQRGKTWVNSTKTCLMTSLFRHLIEEVHSCDALTVEAFGDHENCYNELGFCSVMSSNKAIFYNIYDLFEDFLFTRDWYVVWKQIFNTLWHCREIDHWKFSLHDIHVLTYDMTQTVKRNMLDILLFHKQYR